MKKEQKEKELYFQPIGRTKGGWISSAEQRLDDALARARHAAPGADAPGADEPAAPSAADKDASSR